jgi:hypothetical protein
MKKWMMLSIVAAVTVSLVGCQGAWPRCWWYQGDACDTCPTYQSYPAMTEGWVAPSTIAPEVMPGPATTAPAPATTQPSA